MRKKPYTGIGIKRLKCFRCNNRASFQWTICSDGNIYRPICTECDIQLNEVVLRFMKFPDWQIKIDKYKKLKLPHTHLAE
jgi:transcription elongation factor Elf1